MSVGELIDDETGQFGTYESEPVPVSEACFPADSAMLHAIISVEMKQLNGANSEWREDLLPAFRNLPCREYRHNSLECLDNVLHVDIVSHESIKEEQSTFEIMPKVVRI